jgi:hypothetical protein
MVKAPPAATKDRWMTTTLGFSAGSAGELGRTIDEAEYDLSMRYAGCVVRVKQVALSTFFGDSDFHHDALVVYEFLYVAED